MEYLIGHDGTLKFLVVIMTAYLYWLGGRDPKWPWMGKWIRRFIAPLPLVIYCYFLGSESLISYPLYAFAYWAGYGKDSKLMRWFKKEDIVRFICGIYYTVASLGVFLATKNITLFSLQIFIGIFCTILFSRVIKIPAAKEENLICYFTTFLVPWYGNFV